MEPEEMDVVELLEDVTVDPAWRICPDVTLAALEKGRRGMVVHRHDRTPPLYDVEFLDPETRDPLVLATLPSDLLRVVERDTLAIE
jgi:hypothetical protein